MHFAEPFRITDPEAEVLSAVAREHFGIGATIWIRHWPIEARHAGSDVAFAIFVDPQDEAVALNAAGEVPAENHHRLLRNFAVTALEKLGGDGGGQSADEVEPDEYEDVSIQLILDEEIPHAPQAFDLYARGALGRTLIDDNGVPPDATIVLDMVPLAERHDAAARRPLVGRAAADRPAATFHGDLEAVTIALGASLADLRAATRLGDELAADAAFCALIDQMDRRLFPGILAELGRQAKAGTSLALGAEMVSLSVAHGARHWARIVELRDRLGAIDRLPAAVADLARADRRIVSDVLPSFVELSTRYARNLVGHPHR